MILACNLRCENNFLIIFKIINPAPVSTLTSERKIIEMVNQLTPAMETLKQLMVDSSSATSHPTPIVETRKKFVAVENLSQSLLATMGGFQEVEKSKKSLVKEIYSNKDWNHFINIQNVGKLQQIVKDISWKCEHNLTIQKNTSLGSNKIWLYLLLWLKYIIWVLLVAVPVLVPQ